MKSVFMRYPGGRAKAVTFSYDDGVADDLRLAAIFDRYGLKCTFNHNGAAFRPFSFKNEELREHFIEKGHEIAIHGMGHRANGNMRVIEGIRDVLDCRLDLEERCGTIIRGMAYPDTGITQMGSLGSYEAIKQYLTELDIAYARTLGGKDPDFLLPADFHAWMPTAHHDDPKIFDYIDAFLALDVAALNHARRMPRLLYIWGHSYEFERYGKWEHIEEICRRLSRRDDIFYATNIEICDYVEGYRRLRYSADGHRIYNPSLFEVCIDVDGVAYRIPSGETVVIPKG